MSDVVVKVEDVEVAFSVGRIGRRSSILGVAGVSFEVRRGETFAIVGESGSGKTTLARAINRLRPVSRGAITFEGRRIESLVLTPCRCKPLDCRPAFPSIARKVRSKNS